VNYFLSEAARAEHLEHVAFYEERRAGLGGRYLFAFESAMERVCRNPDRFPVEHPPGIRRIRVPGFPFSVLYRIAPDGVEVLALAHHARRPGYWIS
jgi:toxin ParE1/3/4